MDNPPLDRIAFDAVEDNSVTTSAITASNSDQYSSAVLRLIEYGRWITSANMGGVRGAGRCVMPVFRHPSVGPFGGL